MTEPVFEKRPDLKEIEKKWQDEWEKQEIYHFDPDSEAEVYSIDVPPRYVSGILHIGHAISYTHIDFAARYKRMRGYNVFNPLCFDVNGLPIEVNVEKMGISPHEVGRNKFIEKCSEFGEKNIASMKEQFKLLGHCFDPSIYYQTNSPEYRRITQMTFLQMLENGYVYQGEYPVNYCPRCRTALADAEIEYQELPTEFCYQKFYVSDEHKEEFEHLDKDENGYYVGIATTRPELLSACRLVAVHPDDERYKDLVGKYVVTPVYNEKVRVEADELADKEFGTGAMMVCTFGDKTDVEHVMKYGLDFRKAINEEGIMTNVAGDYAGMPVMEARKKIIGDMEKQGLIYKKEKLNHRVGSCWRCQTAIELLITHQWFIKIIEVKQKILESQEKIAWFPAYMRTRLLHWIESLTWDWCVSRQRYFATPIPVWYCKDCNEIVPAKKEQCYVEPLNDTPPVDRCPKCGGELQPCPDVFDTWVDSSISPLYNAFWGRDEKLFEKLYPMTLRPQSHDIIRTWAFYSILRCTLVTGKHPWDHAAISGFILGPDNRPMHTSWGNVVDPREVIDKYGTEALRYFAANCGLGVDTAYNMETTKHGVDFCIKLWNICRFISGHLRGFDVGSKSEEYSPMDKWILSALKQTTDKVTDAYEKYTFNSGLAVLEDFIWHLLADNYLEIVKHRLYNEDEGSPKKTAGQKVLYMAILSVLKMLAPILPHITEELYVKIFREREKDKSIHLSSWPAAEFFHEEAYKKGEWGVNLLSDLRKWKTENKISMGKEVEELTITLPENEIYEDVIEEIRKTIRIKNLVIEKGKEFSIVT